MVRMRGSLVLTALSSAVFGFFIGISFSVQITPKLVPCGDGDANSTSSSGGNILGGRFWGPLRNNNGTVEGRSVLQPNATSEIIAPRIAKDAARLPPKIVVAESDLHLRRLWGNPREDTPARKYLLALAVGYTEKANVNATVHKFSDNFDVVLFHYDGRTTEWDDEFEWSKQAIHVGARKQAKWWYAKRFLHPSIVAPYEFVFLWDEDLGVDGFDAEEYLRMVRKHELEISQPGLDVTTGGLKTYDVTVRSSNGSDVHKSTAAGNCPDDVHRRPCSGFVEVMAPVFSREAWVCVWHMIQNDLGHGWGLDWNFWRCVDDPEEQIGVVDAQFVVHRGVPTLIGQGNREAGGSSSASIRDREWAEFHAFTARLRHAEEEAQRQQAAALLPAPPPTHGRS